MRWRRVRVWLARLFAILALAGAAAAVAVAVSSVRSRHDVTETQARDAMAQLTGVNRALSTRLTALRPGASPRPAQEAARQAVARATGLGASVSTDGSLGSAVHAVLTAERAYLDAVGSTLNNPRSSLRSAIAERAVALRRALGSLAGGVPSAVSGSAELLTYSRKRIAGH